ncbi:MAG: radical SAM protein [Theionarchaea archaeon]|nr:radical SAM protein [Theionarchaea archaeon]
MNLSIILNCTPPYDLPIPNPALGYLKGFLRTREISVKNVYWNLILASHISKFQKVLEKFIKNSDFLCIYPTLYICRQLLKGSSLEKTTPLDLFYSSVYSQEEITEMVYSVQDCIDRYIRQNNLHEVTLAGFTFKTYQWLMGYYIIQRLKELNPDIRIVIGGIVNKEQAVKFMQIFNQMDFAIYGEGEYPLYYLVKAVEEGTDLNNVPAMIFREGNRVFATKVVQEYPPLDEYPFADHSDYIFSLKKYISHQAFSGYVRTFGRYTSHQFPVFIPIWGSRSCSWKRCKFCMLNEEYSYRARSPKNIVEEIEYQSRKYNIDSFIFIDTELSGNLKRLKTLLKLLLKSSMNREKKYHFFAELSPIFVDSETAENMQLIPFAEIQIGFEGMTDVLLEKMEKRHRFAHNIQALKFGNLHGLYMTGLNVIQGIPPETTGDIVESCGNLRFLRFFLNRYSLNPNFLRLDKGSSFYDEMSEEEREKWTNNPIWTEIEPIYLIPESDKFEFCGFTNPVKNLLWNGFEGLLDYYTQQNFSYEWIEHSHGSLVREKGLYSYEYKFNRDETDLLIFCDTIRNISEIKRRFSHLNENTLLEILRNLKGRGILYYDEDLNWIISVVESAKRKKESSYSDFSPLDPQT